MSESPERGLVRKVVGCVVRDRQLLVFTHNAFPLEVTGVQVPAGTIEQGEAPEAAVVREVFEETGLLARITGALGVERYDVWPSKARHGSSPSQADDGAVMPVHDVTWMSFAPTSELRVFGERFGACSRRASGA